MGVCVVVPTYNNGTTLLSVIHSLQEYCGDIIVVDDGSTDGTGELLKMLPEGVTKISYPVNKGKGHALGRGFDMARERGFRYAATIDSDGQHKASDLPAFVSALEQHPDATREYALQEHVCQPFFQFLVCLADGTHIIRHTGGLSGISSPSHAEHAVPHQPLRG